MPVDRSLERSIREFERLARQALIAEMAWAIIGALVFFGLLYITIRYAIRDGLRDAHRLDRRATAARPRDVIGGPDIRAD